MNIEIFPHNIPILAYFGMTHAFWNLNTATLRDTWVAMGLLFLIAYVGRHALRRGLTVGSYAVMQSIDFFVQMITEAFGTFNMNYFSFILSLFAFTFMCNIVGLLPYLEEPTRDLNTALAIGLISFLYIQSQKVRIHGVLAYLGEFITVVPIRYKILSIILTVLVNIIVVPLNLLGEFAKVVSMSFRLFGNILGGSILFLIALWGVQQIQSYFMIYILLIMPLYLIVTYYVPAHRYRLLHQLVLLLAIFGLLLTFTQLFFGLFEGLVQAYVVTMLTTTYLAVAVTSDTVLEEF